MTTTKVNTKAFLRELEWTARFLDRRTNIPILNTVLIESSENGSLKLSATDLETAGITELAAEAGNFATCVPSARLIKYLKKVEESELTLSVDDRFRLTISHGPDSSVTVDGMSRESYPELPTVQTIGSVSGLATAAPRALMSVAAEESRFTLNGALLDTEKGVLVGTDGHRMSVADISADFTGRVLIPTKALTEVSRICTDEAVPFGESENNITFTVGSRQILSRKLTGNFPNYERVLPNVEHSVEVKSKDLVKVLERVTTFADERSRSARWSIEHAKLTVSTELAETGRAAGSVNLSTNGVTWASAFNSAYMLDGLKALPSVCRFEFSAADDKGNNKAAQFATEGFRYVVMPQRI